MVSTINHCEVSLYFFDHLVWTIYTITSSYKFSRCPTKSPLSICGQ